MPDYTQAEIDDSMWGFHPSLAPNMVGLVFFALILVAQVGQGIYWKQWWFLVTWVLGCGLELIGYIGRVLGYFDINNETAYKIQISCLTLAPALHMAGIYYQLAKLVTVYGKQYSLLKPMQYSSIFIVADVITIFVQAGGGGYAAGSNNANIGRWIMVGGLVAQVVTMSVFIVILGLLLYHIWSDDARNYKWEWRHVRTRTWFPYFIPALCVTILCIYIRSIFRIAELSDGWRGRLVLKEVYFLVLDGLMMLIASASLTIVYPGMCLGREPIPVQGLHYKGDKLPEMIEMEPSRSIRTIPSV